VLEIVPGARVIVRSADDRRVPRRALTGIVQGRDSPVVWVCREDEWESAKRAGRSPEGVPWPADAVQPQKR